jgi:3-deoxy-D-arabino-heptulosonate 7-phosphate (DAHP) synthase class II
MSLILVSSVIMILLLQEKVDKVMNELSRCAPLVFAGEVRTLQQELAKASMGQGTYISKSSSRHHSKCY